MGVTLVFNHSKQLQASTGCMKKLVHLCLYKNYKKTTSNNRIDTIRQTLDNDPS